MTEEECFGHSVAEYEAALDEALETADLPRARAILVRFAVAYPASAGVAFGVLALTEAERSAGLRD